MAGMWNVPLDVDVSIKRHKTFACANGMQSKITNCGSTTPKGLFCSSIAQYLRKIGLSDTLGFQKVASSFKFMSTKLQVHVNAFA